MSIAYDHVIPTTAGPRRRLSRRVRPAPPLEPPLDPPDEEEAAGQRHLALIASTATLLPFESAVGPPSAACPRPAAEIVRDDQFWGPQPTGRTRLPDPGRFARRFLQATMEALCGRRQPAQLRRWTSSSLFADLSRASARATHDGRTALPLVKSVHVCEPVDGVAEIAAVISQGGRCRAVAARLEGVDGQWRCVHLQVG